MPQCGKDIPAIYKVDIIPSFVVTLPSFGECSLKMMPSDLKSEVFSNILKAQSLSKISQKSEGGTALDKSLVGRYNPVNTQPVTQLRII